ncbi:hypothetical protein [Kaarinaea lacus]
MAMGYQDWYIPFQQDQVSLRDAHQSMISVRASQDEIPLMVQLVENPKFQIPGIRLFHGAVDLNQHDYIHIMLGRGLLDKDEAFTIGFTMGSTNKVTTAEENLYSLISQYLYPKVYQFDKDAVEVFKNAVRLGYISSCLPLDEIDFVPYLDSPLREVRRQISLEQSLLLAYYEIEKARYPTAKDSQRLLNTQSESVVVSTAG